VRINDRGPFARDRIIDLSSAAADILDMKGAGTANVKLEILDEESKDLKNRAINCQPIDIHDRKGVIVKPKEPEPPPPPPPPPPEPKVEEGITRVATVGDGFFVQVAAFHTKSRADALKAKLAHLGEVKIFKAEQDGQTYYKVRFGEFDTMPEAESMRQKVRGTGIRDSRIIQKMDGSFRWDL